MQVGLYLYCVLTVLTCLACLFYELKRILLDMVNGCLTRIPVENVYVFLESIAYGSLATGGRRTLGCL